MTSLHLSSIFHHNKSTSTLSKRSTISPKSQQQQQDESNYSAQRASTLSKVKRFGSLLVRNNKKNDSLARKTRADAIFPPNIDTSLSSSYSLSATSTSTTSSSYSLSATSTSTTSSSDEDDEHLVMPTKTLLTTDILFKHKEELLVSPTAVNTMPITPQNHIVSAVVVVEEEEQDVIYNKELSYKPDLLTLKDIQPVVEQEEKLDPTKLSIVSLVRYQLNMALEEADKEIEFELESCRNQMLETLYAIPPFTF